MTLITTEHEIELAAMKIANDNWFAAAQIRREWEAECDHLKAARLYTFATHIEINRAIAAATPSKIDKQYIRDLIVTFAGADRVIAKKNGSFVARRSYYYHAGYTTARLATQICAVLGKYGYTVTILGKRDNFQPWPRDSYVEITFAVK